MKKIKMLTSALALCTIASSAFADYRVNIIGSTAYRKDAYAALLTFYGSGLAANYPYGYGGSPQGSGAGNGSTNLVWKGTVGGQVVTIKTFWSGSAGGIGAVADNTQVATYLNDPPASNTDYETPSASTVPNFAFSDCSQSSTFYTRASDTTLTPYSIKVGTKTVTGFAVIPFVWAKGLSTNSPGYTSITNISTGKAGAANTALGSPFGVNLAQLTGNPADTNHGFVYVVGRNDDSGTRTIALIDSGYGFRNFVNQYDIYAGTPPDIEPDTTPNPDSVITGNLGGGYGAGSQVSGALNIDVSSATSNTNGVEGPYFPIGYVGLADANNLSFPFTGGNGQWLTYNGVALSSNTVFQGQYSFWSKEEFYTRASTLGDPNLGSNGFYGAFTQIILTNANPANGTYLFSGLQVNRSADGGAISHN